MKNLLFYIMQRDFDLANKYLAINRIRIITLHRSDYQGYRAEICVGYTSDEGFIERYARRKDALADFNEVLAVRDKLHPLGNLANGRIPMWIEKRNRHWEVM